MAKFGNRTKEDFVYQEVLFDFRVKMLNFLIEVVQISQKVETKAEKIY